MVGHPPPHPPKKLPGYTTASSVGNADIHKQASLRLRFIRDTTGYAYAVLVSSCTALAQSPNAVADIRDSIQRVLLRSVVSLSWVFPNGTGIPALRAVHRGAPCPRLPQQG